MTIARKLRGAASHASGLAAERAAETALTGDGWTILGRRLRTAAGEIDLVAQRDGLLAFIEVKARQNLATAALSLSRRQQTRLLAAGEIVLAEHPDWGANGVRFDVLVVDPQARVRRVANAFRVE